MKKGVLIFSSVLFCSLLSAGLHAADDAWILAASPFTVTGVSNADTASSLGRTLPVLILERIRKLGNRTLSLDELESREAYTYRQDRLSLMLELSAAVKKRDAIVFENLSDYEKKKKLEQADKSITEIKSRMAKLSQPRESPAADTADTFYLPLKIWKDNPAELYVPANGAASETELLKEGISALLTGTVTVRGDYILVQTRVTVYPGGIVAGDAADAGSLDDLPFLVESLSRALTPVLLNMAPARLTFSTEPPDSNVYFDDRLLSFSSGTLDAEPGIHTVIIERSGYQSVSFTYDFLGGGEYTVTSALKELTDIPLVIVTDNLPGAVFLDGIPAGNVPASVTVNNRSVLGQFVGDDGLSTFFIIDAAAPGIIRLDPYTTDVSARIERKRKIMYGSLAGLLISLPLTLFSYGTYLSSHNSWALGYIGPEQKDIWQAVSIGSGALSAALGINFAVQLGIYIYTANKILPETVQTQ